MEQYVAGKIDHNVNSVMMVDESGQVRWVKPETMQIVSPSNDVDADSRANLVASHALFKR